MQKYKEYQLNELMRRIIKADFAGNQSAFSRAVGKEKQTIYSYFNNKKRLGWRQFILFAEKCNRNVKISIEKKDEK